jgi:hypothetical protein
MSGRETPRTPGVFPPTASTSATVSMDVATAEWMTQEIKRAVEEERKTAGVLTQTLLRTMKEAISDKDKEGGIVPAPEPFDGQPANYRKFKRQFEAYIADRPRKFENQERRIRFVLSYMTKGLAEGWAANYEGQVKLLEDAEQEIPSYYQFLGLLDAAFTNTQEKKDAQKKLKEIKQGN